MKKMTDTELSMLLSECAGEMRGRCPFVRFAYDLDWPYGRASQLYNHGPTCECPPAEALGWLESAGLA